MKFHVGVVHAQPRTVQRAKTATARPQREKLGIHRTRSPKYYMHDDQPQG